MFFINIVFLAIYKMSDDITTPPERTRKAGGSICAMGLCNNYVTSERTFLVFHMVPQRHK